MSTRSMIRESRIKHDKHDKTTALLHRQWCKTYGFEMHKKYYEHFVEREMRVLKNDRVMILWDFLLQTETKIDLNTPDLI